MKRKERIHTIAWGVSLLALPVAILIAYKKGSPLQVIAWFGFVVTIMLYKLIPQALELKEVYNDEV